MAEESKAAEAGETPPAPPALEAAAPTIYAKYDGRATQYVTKATEEMEVVVGEKGPEAYEPTTMMNLFNDAVERYGDNVALNWEEAQEAEGADEPQMVWTTMTWREYKAQVYSFAKSLMSIDFQPFQSVNIIGFNSKEWIIANLGAIAAGGLAAGIYTTNRPADCHYIADHSEAAVVVCEGKKQLDKFLALQKEGEVKDSKGNNLKPLSMLRALVVWKISAAELEEAQKTSDVPVHSFDAFMKLGEATEDAAVEERCAAQKPGGASTLIYTSGTTGPPKAVMISHDNATWTARVFAEHTNLGATDRCVSYLPLSHIAAQMCDIFTPLSTGMQVYFARPDALKGSLGGTLKAVKPTLFFGVPRVWEKLQMAVGASLATLQANGGVKNDIVQWSRKKATARSQLRQYGAGGGAPCCYGAANRLGLSKIKKALGLEEARMCATGAAPIARETLDFFASIDIHVLELFGQSECTGPQTTNTSQEWRLGTTGKAMPGTEMRLIKDEASGRDEICYRGRHIFMGYMKNEEKTKEAIDAEGWLHSGDVGHIDEDGFMSITGRIKELIITAGGENIPPVLIEEMWKDEMGAISNCCTIGDRRKYLTMLVAPGMEINPDTGGPAEGYKLDKRSLAAAAKIGSEATNLDEMKGCEKFKKYFDDGMAAVNAKATSQAQTIKKWSLIPDFAPEVELTPTMKLKRNVVHEKYESLIDSMY